MVSSNTVGSNTENSANQPPSLTSYFAACLYVQPEPFTFRACTSLPCNCLAVQYNQAFLESKTDLPLENYPCLTYCNPTATGFWLSTAGYYSEGLVKLLVWCDSTPQPELHPRALFISWFCKVRLTFVLATHTNGKVKRTFLPTLSFTSCFLSKSKERPGSFQKASNLLLHHSQNKSMPSSLRLATSQATEEKIPNLRGLKCQHG